MRCIAVQYGVVQCKAILHCEKHTQIYEHSAHVESLSICCEKQWWLEKLTREGRVHRHDMD